MGWPFSYIDSVLLCILVVLMLYQVYFYCRYMTVVGRYHRKHRSKVVAADFCPKVSVIVCARNEHRNLQDYLHALLTQDYPCYEVIVVNDGSEDDTQVLLERCAAQCKHLYITFVPRGARVMSSKKLALTIGVKAANYDYLLLTDADCCPISRHWIRDMVQGFALSDKTEVVLGYGAYFEKSGLLGSLIHYDTLFIALQYMGMAQSGHPYMGVGRNLAYKRETFFNNDGFRGLLSERSGDDDLFVNKVANRNNTAVVCTRESVTWSAPKATWREWLHQKRRHLSVSSHYKRTSRWLVGLEPLTRGLLYAVAIAILLWGSSWAVGAMLILLWLRLVMQMSIINTANARLGGRMFGIEIVAYDVMLPVITLWILLSQRLRKRQVRW